MNPPSKLVLTGLRETSVRRRNADRLSSVPDALRAPPDRASYVPAKDGSIELFNGT